MKRILKFLCEWSCSLSRARAASAVARQGNYKLAAQIMKMDCRC
jgi:hypothetical protein